jgi:oligoendopeptidase F
MAGRGLRADNERCLAATQELRQEPMLKPEVIMAMPRMYIQTKAVLLLGAALLCGCESRPESQGAPSAPASTTVKGSSAVTGFVPDGNMPRANVPDANKWDLAPLFADDNAFETALSAAVGKIEALKAFRGKLGNAESLVACLELYFETRLAINKLTLYAQMRFDSFQNDAKLQANNDRALRTFNEFMAASSFIREEVLAASEQAMTQAYAKSTKLAAYRTYLDNLRRRKSRVLSADAERVLGLAGDNLWAEIDLNELPSDHEKTFRALRTDMPLPKIKDEKGAEVQLTFSNIPVYRGSPNREVRREAMEKFFAALKVYQHAYASAFAGQIGFNIFLARSRGYNTAVDAYLDKDNIDPAVYRNLIATVRANIQPLHDYVRLRKEVMGLPELHIYDLYAPLVDSPQKTVPWDEARAILPKALAPLGNDYLAVLETGLDPKAGWLDLYPHQHKDSGAFSSSVFGVHPYVKMNYYNSEDDLSTLAHEYGHALHSYLSMQNQPYPTFNYASFIAEIASTLNEKLLADHLLKETKDNRAERLSLLNGLMETIRTTVYRQTMFAEFELEAHTAAEAGTPLGPEFLNQLYKRLVRDYYGPDFTIGENDDIEWAYVPHFYYKYFLVRHRPLGRHRLGRQAVQGRPSRTRRLPRYAQRRQLQAAARAVARGRRRPHQARRHRRRDAHHGRDHRRDADPAATKKTVMASA